MLREIQYKWWRFKHFMKQKFWYEQIITRINPRQKWLSDKIGRSFVDKDFIFETTLFEGMIHFWDVDNGERCLRHQYEIIQHPSLAAPLDPKNKERYETYRRVYFSLHKCYLWARTRDMAWAEFYDCGYDDTYHEREQEMILQDTLFMQEIIHYRKYMWT